MEYVLETAALTKCYRDFAALKGLTMHVPKGSIYGFVGRNGAGKTTLIRIICGLQEPTSGVYSLYGVKNLEGRIARSRRRMGAVVETPSIYLDMTAEENIRQQCQVLGVPSYEGIPAKRRPGIFPWACGSGWASPWPWRGIRIFWCWTSR